MITTIAIAVAVAVLATLLVCIPATAHVARQAGRRDGYSAACSDCVGAVVVMEDAANHAWRENKIVNWRELVHQFRAAPWLVARYAGTGIDYTEDLRSLVAASGAGAPRPRHAAP